MNINPYPLLWPERHLRTPKEKRWFSQFKVALETAAKECLSELRKFGATDIVITSNFRAQLGSTGEMVGADPGVAIWFLRSKVQTCFVCDLYTDTRSNIRAIGLSVAALRDLERYNAQMFEQMMQANNFDALPANAGSGAIGYFDGCSSPEQIEKRFRNSRQTRIQSGT